MTSWKTLDAVNEQEVEDLSGDLIREGSWLSRLLYFLNGIEWRECTSTDAKYIAAAEGVLACLKGKVQVFWEFMVHGFPSSPSFMYSKHKIPCIGNKWFTQAGQLKGSFMYSSTVTG